MRYNLFLFMFTYKLTKTKSTNVVVSILINKKKLYTEYSFTKHFYKKIDYLMKEIKISTRQILIILVR